MSASQDPKVNWKNVPTRTITAGGVEFAYRELGTNNPGPPVAQKKKPRQRLNACGVII